MVDERIIKKKKYDRNWQKEHKRKFACDLNIDEYLELEELLKKYNLTKVQLVRNAIAELKRK